METTEKESEKPPSKNILSAPKIAEEKAKAKERKAAPYQNPSKAVRTKKGLVVPTPMTKKAPKEKKPPKTFSMTGEMMVTTSAVPSIQSLEKAWKTPELLVDTAGNMFTKSSLEVTVDDRRTIIVLDAEQVELLLKILRIADYAD